MTKAALLQGIDKLERYANAGKLGRFLSTPLKYIVGLSFRRLYYPLSKRGWICEVKSFWSSNIKVVLPASMDIYLIGGKTHDSEIRLARFYLQHLKEDDDALDIGAHIGYFSLLASLLNSKGRVVAIEASPNTFEILQSNIADRKNIKALNLAISNQKGTIEFLEFPVLYSEFNTIEQEQYQNEEWFKKINARKVQIPTITASELITQENISPRIIKIDVEGAEEKAILGLQAFLQNNDAYVVMEFATHERGNENHIKAEQHLRAIQYLPHRIKADGFLELLSTDTSAYVSANTEDSDNIVYSKA